MRGAGVFIEPDVATKLDLSADQKKEVRAILQEMVEQNAKIREEHQGDPQAIMKQSEECAKRRCRRPPPS